MRDYMSNINNTQYLSFVSMMEDFQLKDENKSDETNGLYSSILPPPPPSSQDKNKNNNNNDHDKNISNNADTPGIGLSGSDLTFAAAKDMRLPEDYKGVAILSVVPNGPTAKAGLNGTVLDVDNNGYLIRKGDVIISVDGNKIDTFTDIAKQIEKKKAGDVLDVTVNRNGAIFNKSITLELPPRL
jgi:C-terminal processing protease CtpA/Prc